MFSQMACTHWSHLPHCTIYKHVQCIKSSVNYKTHILINTEAAYVQLLKFYMHRLNLCIVSFKSHIQDSNLEAQTTRQIEAAYTQTADNHIEAAHTQTVDHTEGYNVMHVHIPVILIQTTGTDLIDHT